MSIWFTKAFIGAVLCKNGRWMRTLLSEEDGDGGFGFVARKRRIVICSKVHAISADLPFHCSDTKLGPAGEFAVDSVSNAPGSAACRDGSTACCICCLESYDPELLVFYMGFGELPKFISSRNLLPSGISSGGVSASSSMVCLMSSRDLLWR